MGKVLILTHPDAFVRLGKDVVRIEALVQLGPHLLHAKADAVQVAAKAAHLAQAHYVEPDLRVVLGRHVVESTLHLHVVVVVVLHQPLHILERYEIDKVHQILLQLVAWLFLDVPDVVAKYLAQFGQQQQQRQQWCPAARWNQCPPDRSFTRDTNHR
uniref:Uncharacterized protein n=1 Tax=Anopheles coluzzii TaxID=1518534 RepID=A0A8W7PX33_ANOCL